MPFTGLLSSTCDIQTKALNTVGYEKVKTWTDAFTDVPCRKDSNNAPTVSDQKIRVNTDDDLFFFDPDVVIRRGNRISFDGDFYDVIKVNKSYGASEVHHLEVVARLTDHD